MEINNHIYNLIAKKLAGEASSQELKDLKQWLREDPANQMEFDRLKKIFREIEWVAKELNIQTNKASLKADMKIGHANPEKINRFPGLVKTLLLRRWAIAAAILCIIAGAWYYAKEVKGNVWQTLAATKHNANTVLPDGSAVSIRKGSLIKWRTDFNKKREIQLSGEAFFDVKHDEKNKFSVITDHSITKVIGTAFMIHSDTHKDEIIVSRGKVSVSDKKKTTSESILEEGQQVVLQHHKFHKTVVTDLNHLSWKTGKLDFKDASLQKVLADISKYYETPVTVDPIAVSKGIFVTAHFDHEELPQVLKEIGLITGLEMKKQSGIIIFYKK